MAVTRINNNQITDASAGNVYVGINAGTKLQDYSITSGKISNSLVYGSDLTISGNLTVNGQTTTIDTVSTVIEDPVIVLASNQTGTPAVDIGFIGERGDQNNIAFVWDESADEFVTAFTTDLVTNTTVTISSYANFHTNDANVAGNLTVGGNIDITGNITSLTVTGNITGGNLLTPGVVTATGNVTGSNLTTAGQVVATGNVTGGNVITVGITSTGSLTASTTVSATGNVSGGNVTTAGQVVATGNVSGGNLVSVGDVTTSTVTASANVAGGNITTAGQVVATGNVSGGNLSAGSGIISTTGNIDGGNVNATSGITAGTTVTATGNVSGGNVTTAGQVVATGNITGGNLITSGTFESASISATGNITGGNLITAGLTSTGSLTASTTIDATGNISGGNLTTVGITSTGSLTASTTISATGNVSGGNVTTGGNVVATANVVGGNVTTAGQVVATGNVTGGNLTTAGLTQTNTLNVTAGANVGTTLGVTGNITGGNLSAGSGIISTTGNIDGANVNATAGITAGTTVIATGNITGGNVNSNATFTGVTANISGNVNAGNVNISTALNVPNITVSGNVLAGNVNSNAAVTGVTITASGNLVGDNANITNGVYSATVDATGNITGGNLITTGDTKTGTLETTGNALIGGNLIVQGNITYINIDDLRVEDPIIILGTGPNGAPLSADDGLDRGIFMEYYTTGLGNAYMGWKNSSGNMVIANDVEFTANDVVGINSYGTLEAGNLYIQSAVSTGNVAGGNITTAGQVVATGNVTGGNLTTGGDVTTSTVTASSNIAGGNLTTVGQVVATGNITGGNINTVGNVTANYLIAESGIVGNITIDDLNVGNITANGFANITGNITGGNISAGSGIITTTGNINGGNLNAINGVTAATGYFTGNVDVLGNLNATIGVVYANSGIFYGNAITGNDAAFAGVPGFTPLGSNVTMQFAANVNSYAQLNYQNINSGNLASTDIVATADNGDDDNNYVNIGINSSTFDDPADYPGFFPNDAYLHNHGGNLILNPETTGKTIKFMIGGTDTSDVIGTVSATGLSVTGTVSGTGNVSGGNITTSGQVVATANVVGGNVTTAGLISAGTTITATGNVAGGNINTAGTVNATGNVNGTGAVFSGNVTAANFIGNISGNIDAGGANTNIQFNDGDVLAGSAAFTFDKVSNAVVASGNITGGNISTGGQFISTGTGSSTTGSGQLYLNGATLNRIDWNTNGTGAPEYTTRSAGAKVVLYPSIGGSATDYALGVEAGALWSGIPGNDGGQFFKWYGGNVPVANLSGTGVFSAVGNVSGGNITTAGQVVATGNVTGANLILTTGIINGPAAGRITINGEDVDVDFAVDGDTVANVFYVDAGTGTASFGSATQTTNAVVAFNATNSVLMPVGNVAQRPATGVTGMLRFNTTADALEVYDNAQWTTVGVPSFTVIADEQFAGDGVTVAFTLGSTQTTASCIVSINGVVQIPTIAYSVSGTTLTFTEAPEPGDIIDVREITTTTTVTSISNLSGNAAITVSDTSNDVSIDGDLIPVGNATQSLGSPTNYWSSLYVAGNTIHLGNLQLKAENGTMAFYESDGTTPAPVAASSVDTTTIASGTSSVSVIASGGNIRANVGGTTVQTISTGLVAITGDLSVTGNATLSGNILGDRVQNGTTSFDIQTPSGNANITVGATSNVAVFTTTGLTLGTGVLTVGSIVNANANGVGNIGSSTTYFNTVFAKATSAQYADLAEKYVADAEYTPGTVVVFGGEQEVTVSSVDADRAVAGVVSTNPSYIMNGGLEAEYVATVALTGRVPCRVTGTVRKGDLMVSAGYGLARAEADPRVGTVIGKALENHEGVQGVIEVVVGRF